MILSLHQKVMIFTDMDIMYMCCLLYYCKDIICNMLLLCVINIVSIIGINKQLFFSVMKETRTRKLPTVRAQAA